MLLVVQAAWNTPYSIVRNAISDLGAIECGTFEGRAVCSPWHVAANVSWALAGACILVGGVLLWPVLAREVVARVGMALVMVAGAGELIVGLNPEDASSWHVPGALTAILGGLAGISVLGAALVRRREWSVVGWSGVVLGAVGFVSAAAGLTVGAERTFGLFERLTAYPILVWITLVGVVVLRRAGAQGRVGAGR